VDNAQDETDGCDLSCSCRTWVINELAALRRELAETVTTRGLVVGDALDGPCVTIMADQRRATIEIRTGDPPARPRTGISVVVSRDDNECYAGISLQRGGDVVAEWLTTATADEASGLCRLVFDDPNGGEPWLVVDLNGVTARRIPPDMTDRPP
jgi:hypothetical protein